MPLLVAEEIYVEVSADLEPVLVLLDCERPNLDLRKLHFDSETELTAMIVAMEYETWVGRPIQDVLEKTLG